jgi:hypothetical protein
MWGSDMINLLDKLSSYNLFNYLLPGIVFVILSSDFTRYSFVQQDIVLGLFLYYFIGLAISRFGSLIIEGSSLFSVGNEVSLYTNSY